MLLLADTESSRNGTDCRDTWREIMSKDLFTVSKNKIIEEAAKLMRKKGVRRLVVLEDERIVGIITETDIAKHLKAIVGGVP